MKSTKLVFLLILLNACTTLNEVTLPAFPVTHTEYDYRIILPEGTTEAVVFWYYGAERREQMILHFGTCTHPHGHY
jgi:hypothetical protein